MNRDPHSATGATEDQTTAPDTPAQFNTTANQPEPPTPHTNTSGEADSEHESFAPRGTLLFLLVMLLGYALYWAYLWFIVVIERGAGGA